MKLNELITLYKFLEEGATVKDFGVDDRDNSIYIIDSKDNMYEFTLDSED